MKEYISYLIICLATIGTSSLWLFSEEEKMNNQRNPSSFSIKKYGSLKIEELNQDLSRYENNEVVCYESKKGLSCNFKIVDVLKEKNNSWVLKRHQREIN